MLRFKAFQGPPEWKFIDPDSGFKYKSKSRTELTAHIRSYRSQNGYESIEMLAMVVENYLCGLPENVGKCEQIPTMHRGLLTYLKGGVALVTNVAYSSTVSLEEADRRATVCKGCKFNVFPEKGQFMEWADQLAFAMVGSLKSTHHEDLGNCSVCTCPLRSKVWYKGVVDPPPDELSQMREVGCWQLSILKKP